MKLSLYLKKQGKSCAELAEEIGATRQIVWKWAERGGKPSGYYISALEKATNGLVRMEDFYK